jgi:hypothetical protein
MKILKYGGLDSFLSSTFNHSSSVLICSKGSYALGYQVMLNFGRENKTLESSSFYKHIDFETNSMAI